MTTLKDNRKYQAMTVADADELFLKIARIKAILDRKSAAHKKRLADLEILHKEDVASELAEYELLTGELADYIQAHKERFLSPRKHKVAQIGSYGITTDPAYVTIEDASGRSYSVPKLELMKNSLYTFASNNSQQERKEQISYYQKAR